MIQIVMCGEYLAFGVCCMVHSVCSGELERPLITYGVLIGTVIQCSKVE